MNINTSPAATARQATRLANHPDIAAATDADLALIIAAETDTHARLNRRALIDAGRTRGERAAARVAHERLTAARILLATRTH